MSVKDKSEKENRLNNLYCDYLKDQSLHELLVNGLNSIDSTEYNKLTKYARWLRDVIVMVEDIPISVSISSRETKNSVTYPLVYVNKAFENMTGYTRNEIVGKNCNFLQSRTTESESENKAKKEMSRLLADGHICKILITNYKKGNIQFRNLISLFPISYKSGDICYYMGIQCDLSDPNTPYNYIMLVDDLVSIIPKIIDDEDNNVNFNIENIIESIGIYKEIEGQFTPQRPIKHTKRSFPHRRSSIFIGPPICIDDLVEKTDVKLL